MVFDLNIITGIVVSGTNLQLLKDFKMGGRKLGAVSEWRATSKRPRHPHHDLSCTVSNLRHAVPLGNEPQVVELKVKLQHD